MVHRPGTGLPYGDVDSIIQGEESVKAEENPTSAKALEMAWKRMAGVLVMCLRKLGSTAQ